MNVAREGKSRLLSADTDARGTFPVSALIDPFEKRTAQNGLTST